jgi:hypothetical protein
MGIPVELERVRVAILKGYSVLFELQHSTLNMDEGVDSLIK